ncbi:MAG TPA: glycosyl transferase family protein [Spongiibacteraceae bacterium]|jgi:anthranilate phosphoribosyltransferase|nr:glycosyl transferase family protein [Spongiibacteraceae bacterium]
MRRVLRTAKPGEHPFAAYVRILGKGKTTARSLTADEAETAMGMILRGEVEDVQLGAFLMLLRVKEESAEELAGFVRACRQHIEAPIDLAVDLDWASYAGKRRQLPWYLLAALALADSGLRVLMHGAAGHTAGRVYSEDVLAALGLPPASDWSEVRAQLASGGFSFLPLHALCPPLAAIIELRPLLGLRSPVHTLSRLLNPTGARCSLQSIFHPSYAPGHQQAARQLGQRRVAVFKGEGGEAECRPEADTLVHYVRDGQLEELRWPRQASERGTDAPLDLAPMLALWRGTGRDTYGEQAVLGTLAIALHLLRDDLTPVTALDAARQLWDVRRRDRL